MFIGDRGFARCQGKWGLYTPDSICKGETQLSTIKANQTRCITRVRNTIERGFGRLKQWNFIGSMVNADFIPIIGSIVRILCGVDNAYFSNLVSDNNDVLEQAQDIKRNIQLENLIVHMEANTSGLRKANTSDLSSIMTSYDVNDVKQCAGEYSVRTAYSYLGHIQQQWSTYVHPNFPTTIKIKNITSGYKTTDNPKKHTVWVRFDHNKLYDISCCCTWKSCSRTAGGTCSHATAALITLNYWKNNKKIPSFYATSASLFLNVLDCTMYKRNNMKQTLEEYYDASSDLASQTISISQGTSSTEVANEKDTSSDTSDEDSMDAQATDEELRSNETNDEDARYELYTEATP